MLPNTPRFLRGPLKIYKPDTIHRDCIFFCTSNARIYVNGRRYDGGEDLPTDTDVVTGLTATPDGLQVTFMELGKTKTVRLVEEGDPFLEYTEGGTKSMVGLGSDPGTGKVWLTGVAGTPVSEVPVSTYSPGVPGISTSEVTPGLTASDLTGLSISKILDRVLFKETRPVPGPNPVVTGKATGYPGGLLEAGTVVPEPGPWLSYELVAHDQRTGHDIGVTWETSVTPGTIVRPGQTYVWAPVVKVAAGQDLLSSHGSLVSPGRPAGTITGSPVVLTGENPAWSGSTKLELGATTGIVNPGDTLELGPEIVGVLEYPGLGASQVDGLWERTTQAPIHGQGLVVWRRMVPVGIPVTVKLVKT